MDKAAHSTRTIILIPTMVLTWLMGLALFGNQWVAAVYIGTVGDVVPQQLAGRVAGITGFGDNGASMLAVLLTGAIIERYGWSQVFVGAGMLPVLALLSVFLVLRKIEPARFDTAGQRA